MGFFSSLRRKRRRTNEADSGAPVGMPYEKQEYGDAPMRQMTPPSSAGPNADRYRIEALAPENTVSPETPVQPPKSAPVPIPGSRPAVSTPRSPPQQRLARQGSGEDITALPVKKERDPSPHLSRKGTRRAKDGPQEVPTLPVKSNRLKGEERRRREEEVKAMSPGRSSARDFDIDRDTKRIGSAPDPDIHPALRSQPSLAGGRSVRSSMTDFPDHRRFDVSLFSSLSPRPKIRYSIQGPFISSQIQSMPPSRSESRAQRHPTSRAGLDKNKKIDELAEDMDERSIRELIERDDKRREKKRQRDEERAKKKLEREAQGAVPQLRQPKSRRRREGKADGADGGAIAGPSGVKRTDDSLSPSRKELGDMKQAGISSTSFEEPVIATAQSVRLSQPTLSPVQSEVPRHSRNVSNLSPVENVQPQTAESETVQEPSTAKEVAEAGGAVGAVGITGLAAAEGLKAASSTGRREPREPAPKPPAVEDSTAAEEIEEQSAPPPEPPKRDPRREGIFASLLRRSFPGRREGQDTQQETPSIPSFANVSRESVPKQPLPARRGETEPPIIRSISSGSGVGGKESKFREELPETPPRPTAGAITTSVSSGDITPVPTRQQQGNFAETSEATPTQRRSVEQAADQSAVKLSQSLGGLGAEGSWLASRSEPRTPQDTPLGIRRVSPDDEAESEGTPDDDEEEATIHHGAVARSPTVIHRGTRVRSSEGLLNQFNLEDVKQREALQTPSRAARPTTAEEATDTTETDADEYETASEHSPSQQRPEFIADESELQRATSVSLGSQHIRQVSAGSARLLNIPARNSTKIPSPETSPTYDQGQGY